MLQWGRGHVTAESKRGQPLFTNLMSSMGPRSRDRGIADALSEEFPDGQASMGPRSRDRGIEGTGLTFEAVEKASMGPRSRDRGIIASRAGSRCLIGLLQWGRGHVTA